MNYHFNEIEAKWQAYWTKNQTFAAGQFDKKPKFYVLDMFPYPSGAGLHVGHPLGYIASDIYARYKRHKGFNVLHPQGYDSFGLPAEQYAIQTGQHPALTTAENIKTYRRQLDQLGFSFDWSREVRTSDPSYYRWTQWIFIQLFNSWYNFAANKAEDIQTLISIFEVEGNTTVHAACDDDIARFTAAQWNQYTSKQQQEVLLKYRLTFLSETEVNWCPELGTVLANDEIINGVSERGGYPVIRKKMKQWSMRISAFAERLLTGLDGLDWPQPLKDSQTYWIGKSEGATVTFNLENSSEKISVFTTRPDTIFGVSFMTLAPENALVQKITTPEQQDQVAAYIEATAKRSERERMADVKTISGAFTGAYAIHPFSQKRIPIWIGDYVLASYGTGAVMAVPCGDQRDYDFAKHFNIAIPNIFEGVDISKEAFADKEKTIIANSDFLDGLSYKKASKRAIFELEKLGQGQGKINYRLRDAVFSRQRYWGEPFPVYYVDGLPQMIDEKHLPIVLPEVEKYLPTEDGKPPLGNAEVWAWDTEKNEVVSTALIDHKTVFPLELNTMPGWAGSSFYFNRYMDPHNTDALASKEALAYWKEVDLYIGGSEHATGHLLYARFWQKFLFDRGVVPVDEFAKKLINQGMILGNSAFVFRSVERTDLFVSKSIYQQVTSASLPHDLAKKLAALTGTSNPRFTKIHVDVSMVNTADQLDLNAFSNWRPEFKNAVFMGENGAVLNNETPSNHLATSTWNDTLLVTREVEKMSKSKYNVVNPDDICKHYGADSLRLYEMFLGPLEQAKPWNTAGLTGVHGFLKKLWKLYFGKDGLIVEETKGTAENFKTLHKTIKKVEEDIVQFSFNTSVSTFMIAVNELTAQQCHSREILEPLLVLISPYAPHIAEELWAQLGHDASISTVDFPTFDARFLVENTKNYPISFNGKMRFTMELPLDLDKQAIEDAVMNHEKTVAQLAGRIPKKIIIVPGKIVNIVG